MSDHNIPYKYRIVIEGSLSGDWHEWLGELEINLATRTGTTQFTAAITDQSALMGLLRNLYLLGLPLLSLIRLDKPDQKE
jgi:hypothetical protein